MVFFEAAVSGTKHLEYELCLVTILNIFFFEWYQHLFASPVKVLTKSYSLWLNLLQEKWFSEKFLT